MARFVLQQSATLAMEQPMLQTAVPDSDAEYPELRERVRAYYDDFLPYLERDLVRENPRHTRVLAALRELIRPGCTFLDLGCGIGVTTREACRLGASAVGVDLSPKLIERAASLSDAEFLVADITAIALDRRFDVVALVDAIEHIAPARYDALWEVLSTHVAPGGLLYINYPDPQLMSQLQTEIPDQLQIIDESVPVDTVLSAAAAVGFTLVHEARYSLTPRERYVELLFQRRRDGRHPRPELSAAPTRPILGVWAADDNFHFIAPLVQRLTAHWRIKCFGGHGRQVDEQLRREIDEVDACWFEWAAGPAVPGSRLVEGKPAVVRLHRYEAYTSAPTHICWENIDTLFLVSKGVQGMLERLHPEVLPRVRNLRLLPNAIDTREYPRPVAADRGTRLVWLGRLSPEKNPALALQIIEQLRRRVPDATLTFAGPVSDPVLIDYLLQQVQAMHLDGCVNFAGEIEKRTLPGFLRQFSVILNTSYVEGHSVALLEGMAAGLRPVVHRFIGASDVYPEDWLYDTPAQAVSRIVRRPFTPEEHHDFVVSQYDLAEQSQRVDAVLQAVLARR